MKKYDFDMMVDRKHSGNMKEFITPAEMKAKGITSFAAAEMDFKTAPSVIHSATDMIEKGIYGFTIRTNEYFDAVKWWLKEMRGWETENEWIVPTLGTIYSIATAIRMTCVEDGPGRLIVQSPVYYRYEQAATRMGVETVHNDLRIVDGKYEMDFEDLEQKMADPANRLLVICNAHNPVGKVWDVEDLTRVAELSARYRVPVVSDEIFGEMTFGGHKVVPYASIEAGRKYAMTVVSLGKAFNFTGVNHANMIIPDTELRERYEKVKYATHYGSIGPFEYASILGAYCEEGRDWFIAARDYIEDNALYVQDYFRQNIPQAYIFPVEGTSVCWIDWSSLGMKDGELIRYLEDNALFSVESGSDYDEKYGQFTRMNLSSTREQIEGAMLRLGALFS